MARVLAASSLSALAAGAATQLRFLDAEPDLAGLVEKSLPKTSCGLNSVFLDWGSSGIKVNPVHKKIESAKVDESVKEFKVKHLGADADKDQLLSFLGALKGRLPAHHAGGGAMATAGFRLRPDSAAQTWQTVQEWNTDASLFTSCGFGSDLGCRTLPGAKEAEFEAVATRQAAQSLGLSDSGDHFGMVSCGGASLQLGIWGAAETDAQQCISDIGDLSSKYDKQRTKFSKKNHAFFVSFLANHQASLHPDSSSNDYEIGGVNEMRAEFDAWLVSHDHVHNPCVSSAATKYRAPHPVCDRFIGHGIPCLVDSWGAYMTHLEGAEAPTVEGCNKAIKGFFDQDLLLEDIRKSAACETAVSSMKQWFLLTAFSRQGQLGADVSHATRFADMVKDAEAARHFETDEDGAKGDVGVALTSTLLVTFLDRLGVSPDAKVIASKAEVATFAMAELGLEPGWVQEEACNMSTTAAPEAATKEQTAVATADEHKEAASTTKITTTTAASSTTQAVTTTTVAATTPAATHAATTAAVSSKAPTFKIVTQPPASTFKEVTPAPASGGENTTLKALGVSCGLVGGAFMILCFFQMRRPMGAPAE